MRRESFAEMKATTNHSSTKSSITRGNVPVASIAIAVSIEKVRNLAEL